MKNYLAKSSLYKKKL